MDNLNHHRFTSSEKYLWKTYEFNVIHKYIGTKDQITLIELEKHAVTDIRLDIFDDFDELRTAVRDSLKEISIILHYTNMFEQMITPENGDLFELRNFFG